MIVVRAAFLLLASILLAIITWLTVESIQNGISAHLTGFESEPQEGWDYWRWFFIKRNLTGILIALSTLVALWVFVGWGWLRLCKMHWRKFP